MTDREAMEYLQQMWVESHDRSDEAAKMRLALLTAVVFMEKHLDAIEKPFRNPSVERNEGNRANISPNRFDASNRRISFLESQTKVHADMLNKHDFELAHMDDQINRITAILEEEGLWHE